MLTPIMTSRRKEDDNFEHAQFMVISKGNEKQRQYMTNLWEIFFPSAGIWKSKSKKILIFVKRAEIAQVLGKSHCTDEISQVRKENDSRENMNDPSWCCKGCQMSICCPKIRNLFTFSPPNPIRSPLNLISIDELHEKVVLNINAITVKWYLHLFQFLLPT